MHEPYRNKRIIRCESGWPLNYWRSKIISDRYHEIMKNISEGVQNNIVESPKVTLFGPEAGIIVITFTGKNGEEYKYEVSDSFYDTFSQIRFWLEDLCDEGNDGCSAFVDVDEEELYMLHYEKLPWLQEHLPIDTDKCSKGIFIVISDFEKHTPYYIFCEKKELIKQIYEQVMLFSSGERINTPEYMVEWGDANDDGYPDTEEGQEDYKKDSLSGKQPWKGHKIFQERFRSPIVEAYISANNQ